MYLYVMYNEQFNKNEKRHDWYTKFMSNYDLIHKRILFIGESDYRISFMTRDFTG